MPRPRSRLWNHGATSAGEADSLQNAINAFTVRRCSLLHACTFYSAMEMSSSSAVILLWRFCMLSHAFACFFCLFCLLLLPLLLASSCACFLLHSHAIFCLCILTSANISFVVRTFLCLGIVFFSHCKPVHCLTAITGSPCRHTGSHSQCMKLM